MLASLPVKPNGDPLLPLSSAATSERSSNAFPLDTSYGKKIPFHSLTLAGGSDQLPRTGYVWQGNLYYDIDRVFRLSAFSCQRVERYTTDAIQFAYRRVIVSPLILPPSPSLTVSLCWVVDSAPAEMRRRVLVFSTRLNPLCFNPSLTIHCTSPPYPCQRPNRQTYKNV